MTEDLVKVTQALVKEAGPLFGLQEQDRFSEWAALQAVLKDRGAWHDAVYGVTKTQTQLSG